MRSLFIGMVLCAITPPTGWAGEGPSRATGPAKSATGARDVASSDVSAAQAAALAQLDWLVGQWVDQGPEASLTTTCRWMMNRKFLKRSFALRAEGKVVLEGTQMIGWDPIAQRIHSWTFDSKGGFGQAYWIHDGDRWLAKKTFVLPTGEKASAVNVLTRVDNDTLQFQSISREVGGNLMPNIPAVTIVRKDAKADKQSPKSAVDGEDSK